MANFQSGKWDAGSTGWFYAIRVVALLAGMVNAGASAQETILLEGIIDAEAYKTDDRSYFLARNDGDISGLGRLQLWSALQMTPDLQIYALGELEADDSTGEVETGSELYQLALRYSSNSSPFYVIEAGRLLPPFAVASERQLSTHNPLIGKPNFLYAPYPLGVQVAGSSGWFDYRVALVDKPAIDPQYLPANPDSAFRPDLGVGVTPFTGLRLGLAYTQGPYLNRKLAPFLPTGSHWKDFDQRLVAMEFQFSHGYLELNGELAFGKYDVPFHSDIENLKSLFLEFKYAWTPRWYGAFRLERTDYPVVRHLGEMAWRARSETVYDLEIGLAYRFSPDTQLKIAYRSDHWNVDRGLEYYYPDGHSLALQLSHHFDLRSLFVKDR